MIEVEEAINLLLQYVNPQTQTIKKDILEASTYVLADNIYAPFSVPNFPRSAMDGYAIIDTDSDGASKGTPVTLKVMNDNVTETLKIGSAIKLMTGDIIPEEYNCIIKQEDTDYGEKKLQIYKKIKKWENYRKIGEDIKEGQLIVKKYTRLNSFYVGILASLGISQVNILESIKVGILTVGDEIINPNSELKINKVYNSSAYIVASILKSLGVKVEFMDICPDDIEKVHGKIDEKINSIDILITIGSVSVGEKDVIPEVMRKLGSRELFKHVKMKPGTPVSANVCKDKVILNLSGNPFAAFVNFHILFLPLLEKYMCNEEYGVKKSQAILKVEEIKKAKLQQYIRAYEENGYVSIIDKNTRASIFSNIVDCNCLIELAPNDIKNIGEKVNIIYF